MKPSLSSVTGDSIRTCILRIVRSQISTNRGDKRGAKETRHQECPRTRCWSFLHHLHQGSFSNQRTERPKKSGRSLPNLLRYCKSSSSNCGSGQNKVEVSWESLMAAPRWVSKQNRTSRNDGHFSGKSDTNSNRSNHGCLIL